MIMRVSVHSPHLATPPSGSEACHVQLIQRQSTPRGSRRGRAPGAPVPQARQGALTSLIWPLAPQLVSQSLIQIELRGPWCRRLRRPRGRPTSRWTRILPTKGAPTMQFQRRRPVGRRSEERELRSDKQADIERGHPVAASRSFPLPLKNPTAFGALALPMGLPMLRTGVPQARDQDDAGHPKPDSLAAEMRLVTAVAHQVQGRCADRRR